MKAGDRIGWGVHQDPKTRSQKEFDDKAEQAVLCYVTNNSTIVFAQLMMQPEGGWYPVVGLTNHGMCIILT